jgi:hypothetical protein
LQAIDQNLTETVQRKTSRTNELCIVYAARLKSLNIFYAGEILVTTAVPEQLFIFCNACALFILSS